MSEVHAKMAPTELVNQEAFLYLFIGLLLIAAFAMLPFSFATFLEGVGGRRFAATLESVASSVAPLLDNFAGAIATFVAALVLVAAVTNFGLGDPRFDQSTRSVIGMITMISTFGVLAVAGLTVVVAVVHPLRTAEVAVAIGTAWLCSLVGQVVGTGATAARRAREAKKAWHRLRRRAVKVGIRPGDPKPSARERALAEIALWGIPFVVWVVAAAGVILCLSPTAAWPMLFVLVAPLFFGNSLLTAAVHVTVDQSAPFSMRVALGAIFGAIGTAWSTGMAFTLFSKAPAVPLGVLLLAITALHVVVVTTPRLRQLLPGRSTIERAMTLRALQRGHARAKALKRKARRVEVTMLG